LSGSGCEALLGGIPENRPRMDGQTDGQAEKPTGDSGAPFVPTSPESWDDAEVSPEADAAGSSNDGSSEEITDAGEEPSEQADAGETLDAGMTEEPDGGTPDAGYAEDAASPLEDAGSEIEDAGPPPCTPKTWYADTDDDGYGNPAQKKSSCSQPKGKWVAHAGDCADNNVDVHPGQTTYFGTAYTAPSGKASFDYDCSGQEEPWAGQATAPDACQPTNFCKGAGYEKTARSGTGVYAYCGSLSIMTCSVGLSLNLCTSTHKQTPDPFVCR
jgi:hypothetical protein